MVTLLQGPQKGFHQVNYKMGLAFENGLEAGSLIDQIMEMLIIHFFCKCTCLLSVRHYVGLRV